MCGQSLNRLIERVSYCTAGIFRGVKIFRGFRTWFSPSFSDDTVEAWWSAGEGVVIPSDVVLLTQHYLIEKHNARVSSRSN